MPPIRSRIALFTLLLAATAAAQAQPRGIERITEVEGITEYHLANGLEVLLFPDPSKASITVNVTYLVGSVNEGYGEGGMAHLLEHMLFQGTPEHPDILKEMQDRGAQMNGTTSWERTNYFETFDATPENLAWALELEADRMVNSTVSREDLDSEMTVVRNEFESGENNPVSVLLFRVLNAAYDWHGYGNAPIGTRSDIENVPIERLQAFYRNYYQPDNAVLVVAGRIDEDETLELIAEHFGSIPRPERELIQSYTREPVQDGEREVTVRRVGDIKLLMAGFHTPAGTHEDFVPLQVAASVLADEPSGRLYRALVQAGLAAQVGTQELQLRDPGMLVFIAIIRAEDSIEAAREVLLETIADLEANPITEEEVNRVKNRTLSQLEQMMNNSQAVALQLSNWAAIGDWRMLFLDRDRVRNVTAEQVQEAALHYLKATNRTIGTFIPDPNPDRAEIPERPDLMTLLDGYEGDEARSVGEAFDPSPANILARTTTVDLPGGVKLIMLPKETRGDVVNASIRLNFGDVQSLEGESTVASMTADMLMRGTRERSRQEIQDELDRLQSRLGIGGGAGAFTAGIQSTHENLAAVLALSFEILREPSFPADEFETLRDLALASLELQRSEPQAIVARAYQRHWAQDYPPGDPRYVSTFDEDIEALGALTVADMQRFHDDFLGASDTEISIVGDFDPAEIEALVREQLDGWRSPKPFTQIANPYPDPPIPPVDESFETPDKENAFFMAGMPIRMSTADPDYPAMLLGNYILGSGPASRLFKRIREREGLSYGVGSSFQAQNTVEGATFTANAIAAPQNVAAVEASFRDEVATILRDGYSDEEIAAAKQSWAQSRQLGRAQDGALAGTLLAHAHLGRTIEWDAELEAKVLALDGDEVLAAMRRYLVLDDMAFMKGGDFAAQPD